MAELTLVEAINDGFHVELERDESVLVMGEDVGRAGGVFRATAGLRDRMTVPDHSLLRYAGLFAQRPRCVASLRAMLHDYFGVPVEIQEFIGAWHRLKPENIADLESAGLNNCLALGAIAGDMIWDPQGRFHPSHAVARGPVVLVLRLDDERRCGRCDDAQQVDKRGAAARHCPHHLDACEQ